MPDLFEPNRLGARKHLRIARHDQVVVLARKANELDRLLAFGQATHVVARSPHLPTIGAVRIMGEDRAVVRSVDCDDTRDCIVTFRAQIRASDKAAHTVTNQRDSLGTAVSA